VWSIAHAHILLVYRHLGIQLVHKNYTIIGVMPSRFTIGDADVYIDCCRYWCGGCRNTRFRTNW
jgi:hypothetical protein